jgi:hypothetical protein
LDRKDDRGGKDPFQIGFDTQLKLGIRQFGTGGIGLFQTADRERGIGGMVLVKDAGKE